MDSLTTLPDSYYTLFESRGGSTQDVSFLLDKGLTYLSDSIRNRPHLDVALLGSALPNNVDAIYQKISKSCNAKDINIFLEEISDGSIDRHNSFPYNSHRPIIIKMDMNRMGVKDSTFDLLISDFTVNFDKGEKVQHFFNEINRVLKQDGQAIVTVSANRNYLDVSKWGNSQEKVPSKDVNTYTTRGVGNVKQYMYTLPYYKKYAEEAGLTFEVIDKLDREGDKYAPKFCIKIQKNN